MANRESVEAVFCDGFDEVEAHGPGGFTWMRDAGGTITAMGFVLPGETFMRGISVINGPAPGERVWGWDGNESKPTLTPSILSYDLATAKIETWHGFLTAGRFTSC